MKIEATIAISLLLLGNASFAQRAPKSPAATPPDSALKPESKNVYSMAWDIGEIKNCSTYSGQPTLLLCDDSRISWKESFINMLGDNASFGEDEAYRRAFALALSQSKVFMVSFSEEPWPSPQTGRKLAMWTCTKDTVISCKLLARE